MSCCSSSNCKGEIVAGAYRQDERKNCDYDVAHHAGQKGVVTVVANNRLSASQARKILIICEGGMLQQHVASDLEKSTPKDSDHLLPHH